MTRKVPQKRYRWSAPGSRKGRWCRSIEGAVMSGVSARHSRAGVRVAFDLAAAVALWPGLADEGWKIEAEGKGKP